MLTFLPLEQIDEMDKWEGSELNRAKEILAYELTRTVHGEQEAQKAQTAAKALFGGTGESADMPCIKLEDADFTDGSVDILAILLKTGITKSRGEGRRLVQQGGVTVDDKKVDDFALSFSKDEIAANSLTVKKGKKIFYRVEA